MSHISPAHARDSIVMSITRSAETDNNKIALCASLELASCRAENSQLKQKLYECEATIQSLRQMVAAIADKQLEILGEVVELRRESRAAPMTPPEINTLDSSTSTVPDDIPDWNGYMPDTDSDDWDSPVSSQSSRAFSPYISPLVTSDSGDSEPEPVLPQESGLDPNSMSSRCNDLLQRINEAINTPVSHHYVLEDNWQDDSDN